MRVFLLLALLSASAFAINCGNVNISYVQLAGLLQDVWSCNNPNAAGAQYMQGSYYSCGQILSTNDTLKPVCLNASLPFYCAQDFERAIGDDMWFASVYLDTVNKIPVLNHTTSTVSNATQFAWWYVYNAAFNMPYQYNMTMSNDPSITGTCDPTIYGFNNQNFYPLDGRGFGDVIKLNGVNRNFGFTFQVHLTFNYQGTEYFTFTGDDDVLVYINGFLALDLGGVHAAESANLNLTYVASACNNHMPGFPCVWNGGNVNGGYCPCMLGITPNNIYTFDLFYNERHTVASDLAFSTSLYLVCPFTDWCGVCQGNGQSCCPSSCRVPNACYSNAKCDVNTGECLLTPVTLPTNGTQCDYWTCNATTGAFQLNPVQCTAPNPCLTASCNPNVGCVYTPKDCSSGNGCVQASCNQTTGNCVYVNSTCANSACVSCSPSDACHTAFCTSNGCEQSPIACDDGNACTIDKCDRVSGCTYPEINCHGHDKCKVYSCDSQKGCVATDVDCDDDDKCTFDICDQRDGKCLHLPIPIPKGNRCQGYYCDSGVGMITVNTTCPSGCTCDDSTGCNCPTNSNTSPAVTPVAAGISAGVLAAIIIAAIAGCVCFSVGAHRGYKLLKERQPLTNVGANPLYQAKGTSGENPLYVGVEES